ncbi:hypothetical protein BGW36DRAFT_456523 [Talaromyces proteolyticus]|uniref:Polyketide synthase n=1 Tax=Talaromyces proteolyticus TaxID=1131652 RepID=A0AAD4L4N9_9EURO|nr:uncharacterized protein BGW36DRAFT_456523 [Talaromyces proteolyticus]KAH8704971.1 hypothetical protein BGW36DRAFT_456523 [Talaromyces proteolyticus]
MSATQAPSSYAEPLAIIGFAAKYAQEASDAQKFWQFLIEARQASTPFPNDRLSKDGYYHPDPEHAGTFHAKGAHFLSESPNVFDAAFFNVNKTEVMTLDPQQRLVMENVYHAIENAGIPMNQIVSSNTSVFVSGFNHDHTDRLNLDPEVSQKHRATGSENSMISGRVSWFYDLKGPSMTVDTACSSSMVAFHLAKQSILSGDSDMAIVSGVNVISALPHTLGMSYAGFLNPEGKCFTFDDRADGYSRGEGVGTVIVKSLEKALADGDTIRAVVRATGLNSDGRTPGLTYPNGAAQERLIREVYASAGLSPQDTLYIESHGTGTSAGDPIEVKSISQAFESAQRGQPIYIGALKTNIGHTEGGAGVSGIIKSIMILESGVIPPNANFEQVNPKILMHSWNVRFPTKAIPWPSPGARRISVNCFGLSGTNAHCILEDAHHYFQQYGINGVHNTRAIVPSADEVEQMVLGKYESDKLDSMLDEGVFTNGYKINPSLRIPKLVLLSGFDQEGPKRLSASLLSYIQHRGNLITGQNNEEMLANVAFTLSEKRSRFRWNTYLLSSSLDELQNQLSSESCLPKAINSQKPPRIGFVFTGQGVQYPQMGQELLSFPTFKKSLEEASEYMRRLGSSWYLLDEILKENSESQIDEAALSQPSCTAIQIALVDLLKEWNICPLRVTGHSSGEIAAAYCAGKISREAAWNVAYHRGRITSHIPEETKGAMLAVGMDFCNLQHLVDQIHENNEGELVIACLNGPKNNTASGDEHMIAALQNKLDSQGIFVRRLRTKHAYHSSHMSGIADEYLDAMGHVSGGDRITYTEPVRMFSSSVGKEITDDTLENKFWVHNLVATVKFTTALENMCVDPDGKALDLVLEVGPHSALQSAIKDILADKRSITYQATLNRNDHATTTILNMAGALAVRQVPVNIRALNCSNEVNEVTRKQPKLLVDMPSYPFNHQESGLFETRITRAMRYRPFPRHGLLGAPNHDSNPFRSTWRHFLRVSENPWLKDHVIADNIVFPGAGYIVMAIEAIRQTTKTSIVALRLRDILFKAILIVPDDKEGIETCFSLSPMEDSNVTTSTYWSKFSVSSYDFNHDEWTEHCTGYIAVDAESIPNPITTGHEEELNINNWTYVQHQKNHCKRPTDFTRICDNLSSIGIRFGPLFRNMSDVKISGQRDGTMTGTINIPDVAASMPKNFVHEHWVHPTTLDATLQAGFAAICDYNGKEVLARGNIPGFVKDIWISSSIPDHGKLECYGKASLLAHDTYNFDIHVWDTDSKKGCIALNGIRLMPFQSGFNTKSDKQLCHSIEWGVDFNFLSNTSLPNSIAEPMEYEKENTWFTELQLAAALLAEDGLSELEMHDLPIPLQSCYQRFYDLLRKVRADRAAGLVPSVNDSDWEKYKDNKALKIDLYERVARRDTNGAVLVRMASQIVSFFHQKTDPLYLMFGEDDLMTSYYDEDMKLGPIPDQFQYMMTCIRHTSSNLNILEVGSGTGGFTFQVLQSLCPITKDGTIKGNCIGSYDFTDISPSFFEKAKSRLGDWNHIINYRKMDLGSDPMGQGFLPASYDMIVASNVLHATVDLHHTMKNIRSLLKPNGKLLFLEGIRQDTLYSNMSFSALPGWWLGREPIREWCPYISTDQWHEILCQTGFSGLDVTIPSSRFPEFNKISIMLSTAVQNVEPSRRPQIAIIAPKSDDEDVSLRLVDQIKKEYGDCTILYPSDLLGMELKETICISLLELQTPILRGLGETLYGQVKHLLSTCNRLLWVTGTHHPSFEMATGLIRTLRWERDWHGLNLIRLTVDTQNSSNDIIARDISRIVRYQFLNQDQNREYWNAEYSLQGGQILTNRIVENEDATEVIKSKLSIPDPIPMTWEEIKQPVKIQIGQPGALESLYWTADSSAGQSLRPKEIEVEIRAVGLNFRDLLTAMGELPQDTIGGEAAGIVTRLGSQVSKFQIGDRVAYFGDPQYPGTFRTLGTANEELAVQVPDQFSFEQAASMPVVYTTVIHSLKNVAHLHEGESILIHAAAGGIGQAAIQYANFVGAQIYATVSTVEKKNLLIDRYGIQEDHIFSSRDLKFSEQLKQLTPDGVDVVLNSLSGEALRQSWECIAPFGRFIEIGKRDLLIGGKLDMTPFLKNAVFASVDLLTVAGQRPSLVGKLLEDMTRLWSKGYIREPYPLSVLPYSKLQAGLRSLQTGQNMGKIVFVPNGGNVPVMPESISPYKLNSDGCYILAGGLGGIGRSIANWMASKGAKRLIFLHRPGKLSQAAENTISALETMGCQTYVFSCDISDRERLGSVIKHIEENISPIRGCINCSVAWKDAAFENMSYDGWLTPMNAKVRGSWNLHELLPSHNLEFFVMLSSVAGIIGTRSQANYNAGNSFQDALARYRVAQGLPGASIDFSPVVSVGFIAENQEYVKHTLKALNHHREDEMLAIVEFVLDPRRSITETTSQLVCGLFTPSMYEECGMPSPRHLQYPIFRHLQDASSDATPKEERKNQYHIQGLLQAAQTSAEAADVICYGIQKKLASVLSVSDEDIDPSRSLRDNGVDSLIEMEFRTWVSKELGVTLGKADINTKSLAHLSTKVAGSSPYVHFQS